MSLIKELSDRLKEQGLTLAAAESCTGGLLSGAFTTLPGASKFFLGGIVAYANSVKAALLQVDADSLARYGAVSQQVAREMALGARTAMGSDLAISITGIAGPDSDDTVKPVGLVYIGLACEEGVQVECCHFSGDRDSIRIQSVQAALELLKRYLEGDLF